MFFLRLLTGFGIPDWLARLIIILVIGAAIAASYGYTYHSGRLFEREVWKAKIAEYEEQLTKNKKIYDTLVGTMVSDNQKLVQGLEERLKASEARKDKVKIIIKEVPKYVTPNADRQCVLTTGFSWMYNQSLSTPTTAGVPESQPNDVDAPSGVAISEVAAISASNNSECAARGEVIKAWQEWYVSTKATWDAIRAGTPAAPAIPH